MDNSNRRILNIAEEFLGQSSVICYEKPFLNFLKKKVLDLGYDVVIDEDYKYLVVKPKNNSKIKSKLNSKYLFSVHVDRHGLIKNEENLVEYAAFYFKKKFGLKFRREEIEEQEFSLVNDLNLKVDDFDVSIKGDYLLFKEVESNSLLKFVRQGGEDFFVKTGIRHTREKIFSYDKETGEVFSNFFTKRYDIDLKNKIVSFNLDKNLEEKDEIFRFNSNIDVIGNKFCGQIDNVISCAVLFYILENFEFNDEIIFTTREEIGDSWQCVVDYVKDFKKQDLKLIVLDTSPYSDFEGRDKGFLTLRHGDENGGFDSNLVEEIKFLLEKNNIGYDFKPSFIGRTELGRVSTNTKGQVNGTTLQLPTLNYHTTYETATLKSLENYYKIIKELVLRNQKS